MPTSLPDHGIYFRKGHVDDRLLDGLLTFKLTVVIFSPLGVYEKELIFTGTDLATIVADIVAAVANLGAVRGLEVSRSLGGTLDPRARALPAPALEAAPAEPGA